MTTQQRTSRSLAQSADNMKLRSGTQVLPQGTGRYVRNGKFDFLRLPNDIRFMVYDLLVPHEISLVLWQQSKFDKRLHASCGTNFPDPPPRYFCFVARPCNECMPKNGENLRDILNLPSLRNSCRELRGQMELPVFRSLRLHLRCYCDLALLTQQCPDFASKVQFLHLQDGGLIPDGCRLSGLESLKILSLGLATACALKKEEGWTQGFQSLVDFEPLTEIHEKAINRIISGSGKKFVHAFLGDATSQRHAVLHCCLHRMPRRSPIRIYTKVNSRSGLRSSLAGTYTKRSEAATFVAKRADWERSEVKASWLQQLILQDEAPRR
jgi:hypothetical protein